MTDTESSSDQMREIDSIQPSPDNLIAPYGRQYHPCTLSLRELVLIHLAHPREREGRLFSIEEDRQDKTRMKELINSYQAWEKNPDDHEAMFEWLEFVARTGNEELWRFYYNNLRADYGLDVEVRLKRQKPQKPFTKGELIRESYLRIKALTNIAAAKIEASKYCEDDKEKQALLEAARFYLQLRRWETEIKREIEEGKRIQRSMRDLLYVLEKGPNDSEFRRSW